MIKHKTDKCIIPVLYRYSLFIKSISLISQHRINSKHYLTIAQLEIHYF